MIFRKMEYEDIKYIVVDELRIFGNTIGDILYDSIDENYMKCFVACDDNKKDKTTKKRKTDRKVVAYISARCFEPVGEILNFYVKEEYRGQKIGLNLLNLAVNELKRSKVKTISLEVRETNEAAIKLYEKLGFKKALVRNNYYPNGESALLMLKEM